MLHRADFADAHRRYLEDAELLFENARWATADHLYGLSAECGLKAVMQALGMPVDAGGKPREREHMKHLPALWPVFLDFVAKHGGGRYVDLLSGSERFHDWSIHNRYARRRNFQDENVRPHRDAAHKIGEVVRSVEQERMT